MGVDKLLSKIGVVGGGVMIALMLAGCGEAVNTPVQPNVSDSQTQSQLNISESQTKNQSQPIEFKIRTETMVGKPGTRQMFGFVQNVYSKDGINYIDVDEADFLGGKEAAQAAIKDKKCIPDKTNDCSTVPNNFYIRDHHKVITFALAQDVSIDRNATSLIALGETVKNQDIMDVPIAGIISYEKFLSLFKKEKPDGHAPYHLTINSKNEVVQMSEQYIP